MTQKIPVSKVLEPTGPKLDILTIQTRMTTLTKMRLGGANLLKSKRTITIRTIRTTSRFLR